jgi:C1A family cysteine protease
MTKYLVGARKSPWDIRDWDFLSFLKDFTGKLPESFDTLSYNAPTVFNQGSIGSCVAASCKIIKEVQEYKDYRLTLPLSARFIYALRSTSPKTGMYPRDALEILRKHGTVLEQEFPYANTYPAANEPPDQQLYSSAIKHTIAGYLRLKGENQIKRALVSLGPVLIVLPVYNYGKTFWKTDSQEKFIGLHAVVITGYDDRGFIVRNSWGSGWAEQGNTVLPFSDTKIVKESWVALDNDTKQYFKSSPEFQKTLRFKKFIWVFLHTLVITAIVVGLGLGVMTLAWIFSLAP